MKLKAYAKINLLLDITGKLENGYHSLFMLMQSVSLYDTLEVEIRPGSGITLHCGNALIPCDERNTACKAAQVFLTALKEKTGAENTDHAVFITLQKEIPHEAGLAGGSADAAAVLYALNELTGAAFCQRELITLALKVGSDVPFCLYGGTCLVQHTGGVLSPVPNLSGDDSDFTVLCKPSHGVSTVSAYRDYDEAQHIRHLDRDGMINAAAARDKKSIYRLCDNVFEQVIEVPERAAIKSVMRKHGAMCCCMTGSGPTVFGIFREKENADACARELKESYEQTYLCTPVAGGIERV